VSHTSDARDFRDAGDYYVACLAALVDRPSRALKGDIKGHGAPGEPEGHVRERRHCALPGLDLDDRRDLLSRGFLVANIPLGSQRDLTTNNERRAAAYLCSAAELLAHRPRELGGLLVGYLLRDRAGVLAFRPRVREAAHHRHLVLKALGHGRTSHVVGQVPDLKDHVAVLVAAACRITRVVVAVGLARLARAAAAVLAVHSRARVGLVAFAADRAPTVPARAVTVAVEDVAAPKVCDVESAAVA
jgi:hypothetical protein